MCPPRSSQGSRRTVEYLKSSTRFRASPTLHTSPHSSSPTLIFPTGQRKRLRSVASPLWPSKRCDWRSQDWRRIRTKPSSYQMPCFSISCYGTWQSWRSLKRSCRIIGRGLCIIERTEMTSQRLLVRSLKGAERYWSEKGLFSGSHVFSKVSSDAAPRSLRHVAPRTRGDRAQPHRTLNQLASVALLPSPHPPLSLVHYRPCRSLRTLFTRMGVKQVPLPDDNPRAVAAS